MKIQAKKTNKNLMSICSSNSRYWNKHWKNYYFLLQVLLPLQLKFQLQWNKQLYKNNSFKCCKSIQEAVDSGCSFWSCKRRHKRSMHFSCQFSLQLCRRQQAMFPKKEKAPHLWNKQRQWICTRKVKVDSW